MGVNPWALGVDSFQKCALYPYRICHRPICVHTPACVIWWSLPPGVLIPCLPIRQPSFPHLEGCVVIAPRCFEPQPAHKTAKFHSLGSVCLWLCCGSVGLWVCCGSCGLLWVCGLLLDLVVCCGSDIGLFGALGKLCGPTHISTTTAQTKGNTMVEITYMLCRMLHEGLTCYTWWPCSPTKPPNLEHQFPNRHGTH